MATPSISLVPPDGRIQVRLLMGSDLLAANGALQGMSDPYCQIYLRRTKEHFSSERTNNTIQPRWHQSFFFSNVCRDDVLDVFCWDSNLTCSDVPLGQVSIPVSYAIDVSDAILTGKTPPSLPLCLAGSRSSNPSISSPSTSYSQLGSSADLTLPQVAEPVARPHPHNPHVTPSTGDPHFTPHARSAPARPPTNTAVAGTPYVDRPDSAPRQTQATHVDTVHVAGGAVARPHPMPRPPSLTEPSAPAVDLYPDPNKTGGSMEAFYPQSKDASCSAEPSAPPIPDLKKESAAASTAPPPAPPPPTWSVQGKPAIPPPPRPSVGLRLQQMYPSPSGPPNPPPPPPFAPKPPPTAPLPPPGAAPLPPPGAAPLPLPRTAPLQPQPPVQPRPSGAGTGATTPPPDAPSALSSLKPALQAALSSAAPSMAARVGGVGRTEPACPYSAMREEYDPETQIHLEHVVRQMARPYELSSRGHLWISVMDSRFPDANAALHSNKYKKFITFKYTEKATKDVVGKPLRALGGRALRYVGGAAKPLVDKVKPLHHIGKEFPTWKVDMHYVELVFGTKRQGWNRNYEAARKIFESTTVRGVVKSQHAMLYGGTGVPGFTSVRHSMMAETGALCGGSEFVHLLNHGMRSGKSRMFTYVLKPDRLYVAETGADFFLDMNSKHAMHANASEEVVFAGEFHIRRRPLVGEEMMYTVVLDNNSGTYSPSKTELPLLLEVFVRNFACRTVDFEVYDREDERLHQSVQENSAGNSQIVSTTNLPVVEDTAVTV